MNNFKREIRLSIGGLSFEYPGFTVYFTVNFGDDPESNDTEIQIYNLSENTINQIRKHQPVILNAGYRGDVGSIHLGAVQNVSTSKEGVDKITTITSTDASEAWNDLDVSETFAAGTTAEQVLNRFLSMTGLSIGAFVLPNNVQYLRARTFRGKLRQVLKNIAGDCGAKLHILNEKIFIRPKSAGDDIGFLLDSDHGLVGTPERFEDEENSGYNVTALLNHRMTTDGLVAIASSTANGKFRIKSGSHKCDASQFYSELKVVE
ncbi:hypothetical protein F9U64_01150 [Gracilibacillus oryzae]|uniref:Uncharacterized protein n=1 Tax=Gracilibacillus oryzae TaxID=1672701 RepID=A0A7C8KY21_9BACI|nr:hypothetical protein [Gracilibacillus oryzae]KAB8139260.1 hypothetical protein F9U64_01150 [Gracilibacillus oryzae]